MAHDIGAPDQVAPDRDQPDSGAPDAAARNEQLPLRSPLSERIVALPPPKSMEAFRTKVKVKPPVVVPTLAGDDLTRIRGISAVLGAQLKAVGVSRFEQIAAWDQSDVQNISKILDLGRTISRQNWIEQAALLTARAHGSARDFAPSPALLAPGSVPVLVPVAPAPSALPSVLLSAVYAQRPPVVPVPVVPQSAVLGAVAPPVTLPLLQTPVALPRVVAVDSPGDAKFHQAVVYVAPAIAREIASEPVALPPRSLWIPAVPVPEVPPQLGRQAPFLVPVPVVPASVARLPIGPVADATPPSLPLPVTAETGDAAASLASEDDVLETQLHDALAAAADDRAVAATIDLISAFAPPPLLEPTAETLAAERSPDDANVDASHQFARYVPPTPLLVPTPPQSAPRVAEGWSPMPWAAGATMPGTAQAVASAPTVVPRAPTATPQSIPLPSIAPEPPQFVPATPVWSHQRDRWQPTGAAPSEPVPELLVPVAPTPVAPTMLDRLASLEAELSALAANDQPRAHVAMTQASLAAAGPSVSAAHTMRPPPAPAPDPLRDPTQSAGRRAGVRSEPAAIAYYVEPERPTGPELNGPELTGRDSLSGGEADVMILPRGGDPVDIRSIASGPTIGTLEQRMRRARPTPEVDVETYAGYHGAISEASVEIVRRDTQTRAVVFSDHGDVGDDGNLRGREGSVRKFFKALKGDAN
jgi:predicted flap endonuclease-1-like 5' DNA nuclease